MKIRFGVIGLGGMGQAHAGSLKEIPGAELAAVSDVDAVATKETSEKYKVPGFTDYKKLLEGKLVDAVIVATPHFFHPEVGIAAMERGIHCLSEKPIAVTVKEADEFVKAAKKNKRVFAVMYQMRALSQVRLAKKILEEGKLGEVRRTCCISRWYRSQAYYGSASWRATWKGEGGGVLINQAPHTIDLFVLFGGLPKRVTANVRTRLHKIEVEDEVSAFLEYENGTWGHFYVTTNEPGVPERDTIEILGDKGKLVFQGDELRFFSFESPITKFTSSAKDMWAGLKTTEEKLKLPRCEVGHREIIRNFCRSITSGEKLLAPGEEGLRTVEFFNSLILSGKKGKPVDIPVDRKEYEKLLESLKKTSKKKKVKKVQRVTDPQHVK